MKQVYYSDVSDTAPTLPATAVEGYPQDGTVSGNAQATVPGAYWFHMVSSELENAIRAGGKTPDATKVNQLAEVIGEMHAATNAVSYEPQTLTDAQRIQAKANISADFCAAAADYGAVGDGSTDDTSAIAAAVATGKRVYLPAGTYAVKNAVVSSLCGEGILKYSTGALQSVKTVGDYKNLRQLVLGEMLPRMRYIVQDMSYCDGYVFTAQQTYSGDGSWTPTARVTLSQYAFSPDPSWTVDLSDGSRGVSPVADVTLTGVCAHGEACRAVKIGSEYYIYSQASNSSANASDGYNSFAKIHWRGASTTSADVVFYRGLKNVRNPMICLTPDASKILFCSTSGSSSATNGVALGWCVAVYDRSAIELASNPATVEPLNVWYTQSRDFGSTRSGFETDGRYVYILVSKSDAGVATQNVIDIYTINGQFVRQVLIDPVATSIPDQWRNGQNNHFVMYREQEGLFIYKDQLVLCSKASTGTAGGVCLYGGRTYVAKMETQGVCPAFSTNWVPTDATIAGAVEYNSSTVYAAPGSGAYLLMFAAIAPAGHYSPDYPLNSTAWSPNKARLEAGERLCISSGEGKEIALSTKYNNLLQHCDMMRVLSDGSVQIHNAQWRAQNLSITRYGEIYFDPAENTLWLGTSANPRTLRLSSVIQSLVNFYVYKTSPALYLASSDVTSSEAPASTKAGMVRKVTSDGATLGHVMFDNAAASGMATLYINEPWANLNAAVRLLVSTSVGKQFYPTTSGDVSLGRSEQLWSQVYAATSAIATSDERLKSNIADPDEALMRAWGKVGFKVFRFKDALAKKGDAARKHIGIIAQQVRDAFASEGLDAADYGLFCYDKWEPQPAEIDAKTGEELVPALEAGDRYSIRYEEALALECAYQRWRLEKLEEKLNG